MRALRPDSGAIALLWLMLAVCLCYANVLTGDFQFDDYNVIVHESQVHTWANWFAHLSSGIRPLLKFTYTLNWTLGAGVSGFHLLNLLIHVLNSYLVYRLARLFVQQQLQHEEFRYVPLCVALLFAVHPINTEAVSYISGRSASLMTLFYLGGMLVYINGRLRQSVLKMYVLTPMLFIAALFVKETAVTFPLALLAWEIFCGGRWKPSLKQAWPSLVILCAAVLFFIYADSYFAQMQRSIEFNSLQGNIATQLAGFAYLMGQWALPLWLNIDPDLPLQAGIGAAGWPLAFCMLCVVLTYICRRKRPWISFALAWAMLQLIPLYLLLPRLDIANERQLYLAVWPLLLACVIELALWIKNGSIQLTAAALLLLALASLTVLRNRAYANEISLWEDTAKKSPHKARVHNNLGFAYRLAQRKVEARKEFTIALQLDPDLYKARYNLQQLDETP
jgi:tetratricopeptide (TPR) repeat protein